MSTLYKFQSIAVGKSCYKLQVTGRRMLSRKAHSHDFYEIILVTDGNVTQRINGTEMHLSLGEYVVLRPGDEHLITAQSDEANVICLPVKKQEFETLADFFGAELLCDFSPSKDIVTYFIDDDLGFCAVCAKKSVGDVGEAYCKRLLAIFITKCLEKDAFSESGIPAPLERAMSEMRNTENLFEGLPAFIRLSGYSHTQLSRLMRKHVGLGAHEYVLGLRLEEAYRRVVFTSDSFEDISESIGYESFSHFNKIFKERFSVTPSVLRKKHGVITV